MKQEWLARSLLIGMVLVVICISITGFLTSQPTNNAATVRLSAVMPEKGGWSSDILYAQVGEPLHLEMVSEDVIHGFAVGAMPSEDVELYPGIPVTTTLLFDKPGVYTFYCTRWCGKNHWRMRGTVEVAGEGDLVVNETPRYVQLALDIDLPHPADAVPAEAAVAHRGEKYAALLPEYALEPESYWGKSPAQLWKDLRAEKVLISLPDQSVWDIVAWIWLQQTKDTAFSRAQQIYAQECAACHGESGKGNGPMVGDLMPFSYSHSDYGHSLMQPPDLSDPAYTLGAPSALLEGKILRGGMGTGMPLYGPIYTKDEINELVNYMYSFVLTYE